MSDLLRRALAAPRLLYHVGAGPLLGHRFLLLVHRGRRSGRRYETLLEVMHWDSAAREACVLSAFGERAQWLQNARAAQAVEVRIGRRRYAPSMRVLTVAEAERVLAAYERRNRMLAPIVRRVLARLAGVRYDGSPASRRAVVERLPIVAFGPTGA